MSDETKTRRNFLALIASSAVAGGAYVLATNSTNANQEQPEPTPLDQEQPEPTPVDSISRSDIVDVREYGAAVDGTNDDTLALRRSIEAAAPGGIVRIPPGNMLVDRRYAPGAIQLTDAESHISIIGSGPSRSRLVMRSGQSAPHILLQIVSESNQASSNIRIGHITLDGNRFEQKNGPGHGIRSLASGGHLTLDNCVIQNTWNAGVKLTGHMSADIRRCVFRNCGNPDVGGAHAVTPNQQSKQETNIRQCMFLNTAGSDVDVGTDEDVDYPSCRIHQCYSEGSPRLLKLDPSNDRTVVSNTKFVAGDGAVPSAGIVANNNTAQCGALELDNVSISDCDAPGIDLGAATGIDGGALESLKLRDVAIQNVDNQNTRNHKDASASGIYAEGTEFVQSGRISIHDVGSDNAGDAVWLNLGCWGEIETVHHAGTAALGRTADVTIGRNAAGTSPLQPDVPQSAHANF